MNKSKKILLVIVIAVIVYAIWQYSKVEATTGNKTENDDLASCLKRKGVKFYGAYYCGYCEKQKEMFGDSKKNLPYIECENPKNPQCANANVKVYPTWIFPNGKKLTGAVNMEQLKEYSEC
jgi:protein-disulfide isomerase